MLKWFSFGGIVSEIRKIEFPTFKQLCKDSFTVFGFLLFMGIFFYLCHAVIAGLLQVIGL